MGKIRGTHTCGFPSERCGLYEREFIGEKVIFLFQERRVGVVAVNIVKEAGLPEQEGFDAQLRVRVLAYEFQGQAHGKPLKRLAVYAEAECSRKGDVAR